MADSFLDKNKLYPSLPPSLFLDGPLPAMPYSIVLGTVWWVRSDGECSGNPRERDAHWLDREGSLGSLMGLL